MRGKKKSELWRIILKLLYLEKHCSPSAFHRPFLSLPASCPIQELVFLDEQRMIPAALNPHPLDTLWGQFSSVFQQFAKNCNYTSLQPFQPKSMSSQYLEHVKCYLKIWNNITSQPYSQNLRCLKERGWGDNYSLGFEMSEQSSSHKQGAQSPLCLWHSMVRAAGNFPDLFTSASMQNIFKKLSLHGKYAQNAFSAHRVSTGYSMGFPVSPPHAALLVSAVLPRLWHCSWVFFQHFVLPTALFLFHFQCSCERCYPWLLSHVLLWIHTLSLIPSLGCLQHCSSGDRVIQFLGNSNYLSLWMLPALPYFRIILICVAFHWVDVSRKNNLKIVAAL